MVRQQSNQVKSHRSFYTARSSFKAILLLVIAGPLTFVSCRATAANLPSGFAEEQFGGNLSGAVTANFGNLVSRSATHGHKCDEKCGYLGCNRSMTPSGMKAPRYPPAKRRTRAESFGPARVVT